MHKILKRFLALSLSAICLPLLVSACGSGGGASLTAIAPEHISGYAVKGPIKGALVQVFKLKSDGTEGELLGSGISGNTGFYDVSIPKVKAVAPLLVKVSGQSGSTYTHEPGVTIQGTTDFTAQESFSAVIDSINKDASYAVTPLTDAAYKYLQKIINNSLENSSTPLEITSAVINAANTRIGLLFNVDDILHDNPTKDNYLQVLTIIDQMIVNTATGNTLQAMNSINQGLADVTQPAYKKFTEAFSTAAQNAGSQNPAVLTLANPPAEPDLTDKTAPNKVTDLKAFASADDASSASVALSWSATTTVGKNNVIGYEIYRGGKKLASSKTASYVNTGLAFETTYTYYIVAFDALGNSSVVSDTVSATTPVKPNLTITTDGDVKNP